MMMWSGASNFQIRFKKRTNGFLAGRFYRFILKRSAWCTEYLVYLQSARDPSSSFAAGGRIQTHQNKCKGSSGYVFAIGMSLVHIDHTAN
jgi:hypothetical protein